MEKPEIIFKETSARCISVSNINEYLNDEELDMLTPVYLYMKIPLMRDGSAEENLLVKIHNCFYNESQSWVNYERIENEFGSFLLSYITATARDIDMVSERLKIPKEEIVRYTTPIMRPKHFEKYFFLVEGYSILWNRITTNSSTQGVKIGNSVGTYIIPKIIKDTYSDRRLELWKQNITQVHNLYLEMGCLMEEGFQIQAKSDTYLVCGTKNDFDPMFNSNIVNEFSAIKDIKDMFEQEELYTNYTTTKLFS